MNIQDIDLTDGDFGFMVRGSRADLLHGGRAVIERAISMAAEQLAHRIVEELGPEIVAKLDAQAIANMTLAEAGAAVNRTLKEKMPDKVMVVERGSSPEIWQRGLFGGLKRVR